MNFSTLLDDLANDREGNAGKLDRMTRWAAEVERADNEARQACDEDAEFCADAIGCRFRPNTSQAEAIVLMAAVYRAIDESHMPLESRYWVLAGLSDCINELLPEVQRQLDTKQQEQQ